MHTFRLSGWIDRIEYLIYWAREENMPKIRTQSYQERQESKVEEWLSFIRISQRPNNLLSGRTEVFSCLSHDQSPLGQSYQQNFDWHSHFSPKCPVFLWQPTKGEATRQVRRNNLSHFVRKRIVEFRYDYALDQWSAGWSPMWFDSSSCLRAVCAGVCRVDWSASWVWV